MPSNLFLLYAFETSPIHGILITRADTNIQIHRISVSIFTIWILKMS